ncbi:hypothetical protein [Streptomyces sp. NBC_00572]|uniref:hypothetical protein n=1 Tax=Streptomyces sp. NBC_00572 TaxID=2903664 RepID=UPI00225AC3DE|nr:hypothetical protein [Streptomyces sp. NBC_00572]MCX4984816.1 hypothetical protein [Streptomyces sp. NBC_00572]
MNEQSVTAGRRARGGGTHGRFVEEGSHEELLRRGGRYANFWKLSWAGAAGGAGRVGA